MKSDKLILGAITGDIIGSVFEWQNVKNVNFELFRCESTFTDDSILTVATMSALLNQNNYAETYHFFGNEYFNKGYGPSFYSWLKSSDLKPYNSWGNGSAMRVSPIGWFCDTLDDIIIEAKKSAEVTHNHPEGIKGAQATASAIYLARIGKTKKQIKEFIETTFLYDLDRKIDNIRPDYEFDVSCQGSVPEAIIAFLESTDYENAIRLAISLGGDSDTIACITGGIAEAYYLSIPEYIVNNVANILDDQLMKIVNEFSVKYKKR